MSSLCLQKPAHKLVSSLESPVKTCKDLEVKKKKKAFIRDHQKESRWGEKRFK